MKTILLSLALLLASGCSAFMVKPVEAPVSHVFSETVRDLPPLTNVVVATVPPSPTATPAYDTAGNKMVGFTAAGTDQLRLMRAVAFGNTELAIGLLDTTNVVIKERNSIVELGKKEEERANYYAQQWALKSQEAAQAERDKNVSTWTNRALWILTLVFLR